MQQPDFIGNLEELRDEVLVVQLFESTLDVLEGNGFFGLLFGHVIGLGGEEGEEFDTASYQQVNAVFGEGEGGVAEPWILQSAGY